MIIKVLVKPGKRKESVEVINGVYVVELTKKPVQGKANKDLMKVLKDYFKKDVRIVSGLTSRKKLVEVL